MKPKISPHANTYYKNYVISVEPHARSGWVAHIHPINDVFASECVFGETPDQAWKRAIHTIDYDLPLPCPACGDPRPGSVWRRTGLDTEAEAMCDHCRGEGIVWGVKALERIGSC